MRDGTVQSRAPMCITRPAACRATTVMALLVVSALPKLQRSNPASPRDMQPDE